MSDQRRVGGHRRPHRKTRNGCLQCKEKRIKCDEGKPSCGRCIRYGSECIFIQAVSPRSKSAANTGLSPQISMESYPGTPNTIATSPTSLMQTSFGHECNIKDLELLHFYTTTTCFSFSDVPNRQSVWQNVLPRLAFQHEFLLHGLLALSALHLSRMQPSQEESLIAHATMHHETALHLFKPVMADITPSNSDACFCFSSLLVPYSSASSKGTVNFFFPDTSDPSNQDKTIEWCRLLRGVHTMVKLSWDTVSEGPLKPLFSLGGDKSAYVGCMPPENRARLLQLEQLWKSGLTDFSDEEREALDRTLEVLMEILDMTSAHNEGVCIAAAVLSWPTTIPEAYMTMVYNRQKEALVLLAHFCMLLTLVDHYWWMNGMARSLLQSIHKTLGSEWESWIMWPLQDLVLSEFRSKAVLL